MLSQGRQLECTVARAGILEVDEPYVELELLTARGHASG
jgi:hypothetical protein